MLAIVFAYTLASPKTVANLQIGVTIVAFFLIATILLSGVGIVVAKKNEPTALKGLAVASFVMLIGVILAMFVVLLQIIWYT
jgi:hypothetical protein